MDERKKMENKRRKRQKATLAKAEESLKNRQDDHAMEAALRRNQEQMLRALEDRMCVFFFNFITGMYVFVTS